MLYRSVIQAYELCCAMERIAHIYTLYINAVHAMLIISGLVYLLFLIFLKDINPEIHYMLQGLIVLVLHIVCHKYRCSACRIVSYERIFIYIGTFIFPMYPLISALFTVEGLVILQLYELFYTIVNTFLKVVDNTVLSFIILGAVMVLNYTIMVVLTYLELKYLNFIKICKKK